MSENIKCTASLQCDTCFGGSLGWKRGRWAVVAGSPYLLIFEYLQREQVCGYCFAFPILFESFKFLAPKELLFRYVIVYQRHLSPKLIHFLKKKNEALV